MCLVFFVVCTVASWSYLNSKISSGSCSLFSSLFVPLHPDPISTQKSLLGRVLCFLRCLYRCILILSQLKNLFWVVFSVCFVVCTVASWSYLNSKISSGSCSLFSSLFVPLHPDPISTQKSLLGRVLCFLRCLYRCILILSQLKNLFWVVFSVFFVVCTVASWSYLNSKISSGSCSLFSSLFVPLHPDPISTQKSLLGRVLCFLRCLYRCILILSQLKNLFWVVFSVFFVVCTVASWSYLNSKISSGSCSLFSSLFVPLHPDPISTQKSLLGRVLCFLRCLYRCILILSQLKNLFWVVFSVFFVVCTVASWSYLNSKISSGSCSLFSSLFVPLHPDPISTQKSLLGRVLCFLRCLYRCILILSQLKNLFWVVFSVFFVVCTVASWSYLNSKISSGSCSLFSSLFVPLHPDPISTQKSLLGRVLCFLRCLYRCILILSQLKNLFWVVFSVFFVVCTVASWSYLNSKISSGSCSLFSSLFVPLHPDPISTQKFFWVVFSVFFVVCTVASWSYLNSKISSGSCSLFSSLFVPLHPDPISTQKSLLGRVLCFLRCLYRCILILSQLKNLFWVVFSVFFVVCTVASWSYLNSKISSGSCSLFSSLFVPLHPDPISTQKSLLGRVLCFLRCLYRCILILSQLKNLFWVVFSVFFVVCTVASWSYLNSKISSGSCSLFSSLFVPLHPDPISTQKSLLGRVLCFLRCLYRCILILSQLKNLFWVVFSVFFVVCTVASWSYLNSKISSGSCSLFSSLFVPLHPDPISTQKSLLGRVLCFLRCLYRCILILSQLKNLFWVVFSVFFVVCTVASWSYLNSKISSGSCSLFSSLFVPLHPDPISTQKSLLGRVLCFLRCLYRCILILSQLKNLFWVVFSVFFVVCTVASWSYLNSKISSGSCSLFSSLFVPLHPDPISTQKSLLGRVLCLFRFCVSSTDLCSLGFILLLIVYFLLLYLDSLQLKSLLTGVFCTRHLQLHLQVISVGFWNPFRQCSIMMVSVLLEKVSYKVNDVHIVVASLTKHFWTTIHVQQSPFTYSI